MAKRVTACGKQVMLDGKHLADARDELAAKVIALAMNEAEKTCEDTCWTREQGETLERFFS